MRIYGLEIADGVIVDDSELGESNRQRLGHDFPECCLIFVQHWSGRGRRVAGTGVVVNKRQVLTAAHVVQGEKNVAISFSRNLRGSKQIFASKIRVHKEYLAGDLHHDLALIEFNKDVSNEVISLAATDDFSNELMVACAGYGSTKNRGVSLSFAKNYAFDLPMISNREWHGESREKIYLYEPDSEFVIGPRPCEFDSGAPVFTSHRPGRKLLGLVSRKVPRRAYASRSVPSCRRDTICTRLDKLNDNDYA